MPALTLTPTPSKLNRYLTSFLSYSIGGRDACYGVISVFYNWLYSPRAGFGLRLDQNPITLIKPPKKPLLILPSFTKEQVEMPIEKAPYIRDKAMISLFTESGLRLSELLVLKDKDINWGL